MAQFNHAGRGEARANHSVPYLHPEGLYILHRKSSDILRLQVNNKRVIVCRKGKPLGLRLRGKRKLLILLKGEISWKL